MACSSEGDDEGGSTGDGDAALGEGDAALGEGDAALGDGDVSTGGGDALGTGGQLTGAAGGQVEDGSGGQTTDGSGGATTDGSGGQSQNGTGGTTPEPTPGSGCDAATWPESGPQTIDIDGQEREYILDLPDGYDSSTPYRLIFVYHGLTGTAQQTAGSGFFGYFGVQNVSDGSAIFVAPQGLPSAPGETDYAWRNTDGEDTAFARAMIQRMTGEYCIDSARIFVAGMSYGGVASNDIGCEVGDLVRAIAPIAGAGPGFGNFMGGGPNCTGQVAALLIHGETDETVPLDSGLGSRDHWVEANGCDPQSAAAHVPNSECQDYEGCSCDSYSGCDSGYPVEWCTHPDGHTIPGFSAQTIWDFFVQF